MGKYFSFWVFVLQESEDRNGVIANQKHVSQKANE